MMEKSYHYSFFAIFLLLLLNATYAVAFDDQVTHPAITDKAITSQFDQYLKSYLGFQSGKQAELYLGNTKLSILKWLTQGSTDEDDPNCRAANHFHDPTKPWDQSQLSDDTTLLTDIIGLYCLNEGWLFTNRKSDITWATGFVSPPPDGQKVTFTQDETHAPINWDKARDYYYKALVEKISTDRETRFAKLFQAVGHVMHLLQDMAVHSNEG